MLPLREGSPIARASHTHRLMAFFRNANVNLLNIHYGIFALVLSGGGAFYGVYLLRAGVSAPGVLTALAAITLCRFAFRPAIPFLAARFGLKPLVIVGTLICACQYLVLTQVHGVGWPLLALIIVSSIGDTFYWTTYHAYFASVGDDHHRGHQISAREALAQIVGIVGPLVTGWMLTVYGPLVAFGASSLTMACAALPFLGTPNVKVAKSVPGAFRAARPGILLFMTDGWIASGYYMAWQISLFVTLHENFNAYGGAMALAAVVGAGAGMLLGRLIDAGHGQRAAILSVAVYAATITLRARQPGPYPGRHRRQRLRRLRHLPLPADPDDAGLQPRQGRPLHPAVPCGHRGRLGHRRLGRLPGRRRPDEPGRAHFGRRGAFIDRGYRRLRIVDAVLCQSG